MFYNDVNCDIFIDKGAGKKLLTDMQNVKKSIKINSPYLSLSLISKLIDLQKKNIIIELITTELIEDYYGNYEKNAHKLITHHRNVNDEAVEKRRRWKYLNKIFTSIIISLFAILSLAFYFLNDLKILIGLIPIMGLFLTINYLQNKIKNERIYSYHYAQLFPFKVFISNDPNQQIATFIHSKIYLIDDAIAYLGSLNFTVSGTKHNYETRIRTTDQNAIKEINKEITIVRLKT